MSNFKINNNIQNQINIYTGNLQYGNPSPINFNKTSLFINQSSRNVGMNTSNPQYNLDVNGDVVCSGTITANGSSVFKTIPNVDIGFQTGLTGQSTQSVAIGYQAGQCNQSYQSLALGLQAGQCNQSFNCTAIGTQAGDISQGIFNHIAVGYQAGYISQATGLANSFAIGYQAGKTNMSRRGVTIGYQAGSSTQVGDACIQIGYQASQYNQNFNTIGIGFQAGQSNQGAYAVSIGTQAGQNTQGSNSISIGSNSALNLQSPASVAVGTSAARFSQSSNAVAIGVNTGDISQSAFGIAIGYQAGNLSQQTGSIAIGSNAGYSNLGTNSIAIGNLAGFSNTPANTIIFNATDISLNATVSGFYVSPIQTIAGTATGALNWNSTTGEMVQYSGKTFVIEHPLDDEKYLVHACLEGPEVGVFYRGEGEIIDKYVEIKLPEYTNNLASNFTVYVFSLNGKVSSTKVKNGKFKVFGSKGLFYYLVIGSRESIEVEPLKNNLKIKGSGPYTYY